MRRNIINIATRNPIIAIISIAAIVRLIFFLTYFSSPEWSQLLVDSLFHDRWATSIASGNVVGEDPFFRAPLYIYILGALYALLGHSLIVARIFGHLVGLLSVYLTYCIASRLFSRKTAIIAALIHSFYPIAIYFESELLVESFFTFLMELSIYFLFVAGDKRRSKWYFLTGLIFGLAAITRPVILPLAPLYILWIFRSSRPIRSALTPAMVFIAAATLAIAPVTIRNLLAGHDLVLVASSGGINFFIGNHHGADGLTATLPQPIGANWQIKDIKYIVEKDIGRQLKPSELSDYWYKKGLEWIWSEKGGFIKLYLKKLYFCLNNFEVPNNRNLSLFFNHQWLLRIIPINFALIAALAAIAVLSLIWSQALDAPKTFLLIYILCYFLIIALYFINARFRLPVVPFIILFAASGLITLISIILKKKTNVRTVTLVLCGAATFFLSVTNFYKIDKENIDSGLYNEANFYLFRGDLGKAIDIYRELLSHSPYYPEANLNLGVAYLKKGMGDSAEFYFRTEITSSPASAKGYSNLASLFYLRQIYDSALYYSDRAIEAKPYLADAYIIRLRIEGARDDTGGFETTLAMAENYFEDNSRLNLEAGLTYAKWRDFNKAELYLKKALNGGRVPIETSDEAFSYSYFSSPGGQPPAIAAQAAYQLGYIYGLLNRLEISVEMSRRAIQLDSNLAPAYVNLANGLLLQHNKKQAYETILIARSRFPQDGAIRAFFEQLK
jgi:4-amino-4-deoxy-L-arabinose transferase-like glycosyltransferase/Flp pilus assembly protein TadD